MKIVNFGSLNLDHVYQVAHAVTTGETIAARDYKITVGGKGLNQSLAVARAGQAIYHAGFVGKGGDGLVECLKESGVDVSLLQITSTPQGHAVIQVNEKGNNCIVIFGGSNQQMSKEYIDQALRQFEEGDYVIVQNEVSNVPYIICRAWEKGCRVIFNASPVDEDVLKIDYNKIAWLIINELEGMAISGAQEISQIIPVLSNRFPKLNVILTLGNDGSVGYIDGKIYRQKALPAKVVDTTAAGDTFLGYCVAGLLSGDAIEDILRIATAASSVAISVPGAAPSIPRREQVNAYLRQLEEQ